MLEVMMIILILLMLICLGYWSAFVRKEGKDERGKVILGKAGQFVYVGLFFCYSTLMIINHYLKFSNDQFSVGLTSLIVVVMLINCLSISILKKRI